MILTGAKFSVIGEALAGPRFKTIVASWLGKSERTIHDYASGDTNIPRDVRKKVAALCYSRGTALVRLALEIDPEVSKIAGTPAPDRL